MVAQTEYRFSQIENHIECERKKNPLYNGVLQLHFYQPIRKLVIEEEQIFDFSQDKWGNINERIAKECYLPMHHERILANPFVTFDIHGTTRDFLKARFPQEWAEIRKTIPKVGDTYVHRIFPLSPKADKIRTLEIGMQAFYEDYGIFPLTIWPPEDALNQETLDVFAKAGIKNVPVASHNVKGEYSSPYYSIATANGNINAIVFDGRLSHHIAFEDISNADDFASMLADNGKILRVFADGETFWHHRGWESGEFLKYLVRYSLPSKNVDFGVYENEDTNGEVRENSSWSCVHGIDRWTGKNGCYCGEANDEVKRVKSDLFDELIIKTNKINEEFEVLGCDDDYIKWFLRERVRLAGGESVSLEGVSPELKDSFKIRLLLDMAWQSCSFFFSGDFERQGAINSIRKVQEIRSKMDIFIFVPQG